MDIQHGKKPLAELKTQFEKFKCREVKWCVHAAVKSARANEITDYLPAKVREKLDVILSV